MHNAIYFTWAIWLVRQHADTPRMITYTPVLPVNVSRPYFSTRHTRKIWCLGTRLGGSLQCFPELLTELWYIEVIIAACITHHILVEKSFWPAAGTTLWLVLPYLVQALLQTWPLPFSSGLSASAWAGMGGGIHAWGHMCVTIQNIDQILPSSLQNCVWLVCFEVKIEASEKASSCLELNPGHLGCAARHGVSWWREFSSHLLAGFWLTAHT